MSFSAHKNVQIDSINKEQLLKLQGGSDTVKELPTAPVSSGCFNGLLLRKILIWKGPTERPSC